MELCWCVQPLLVDRLTLECSCPSGSLVLLEEQLVSGVAGDDCLTYPLSPLVTGFDYLPVNLVLFLSSNNARQCVIIPIAPDDIVEISETFTVELSSTSDAITFDVSRGTVVIRDTSSKERLCIAMICCVDSTTLHAHMCIVMCC